MSDAKVTAYVMGHSIKDGDSSGHKGQLGACPFSCRVLLTLEEKEIPYEIEYINLDNKPEWFMDVNPSGTVPVIKDHTTNEYISDSSKICDYLEDTFSPPDAKPLGKVSDITVDQPGKNVLPAFWEYLQNDANKGKLEAELKALNDAVSNSNPFVGGTTVSAYDIMLAPQLYIARVGCKGLKEWDFLMDFPNLKAYMYRLLGRHSWRNSCSWDDDSILEDIRHKLEKMEK